MKGTVEPPSRSSTAAWTCCARSPSSSAIRCSMDFIVYRSAVWRRPRGWLESSGDHTEAGGRFKTRLCNMHGGVALLRATGIERGTRLAAFGGTPGASTLECGQLRLRNRTTAQYVTMALSRELQSEHPTAGAGNPCLRKRSIERSVGASYEARLGSPPAAVGSAELIQHVQLPVPCYRRRGRQLKH